jgi:hypothetical protein
MRRILVLALVGMALAAPVACTQIDRAVKGFEVGPGGWTRVSEARTDMTSDVEYLGASADGLIIVRLPDGRVEIWKR